MSSKPLVVVSDSSLKYDHTSFAIFGNIMPSATAFQITESIRKMSAAVYPDRTAGTRWIHMSAVGCVELQRT
eukprot:1784359-Amphidinium_carterae.1